MVGGWMNGWMGNDTHLRGDAGGAHVETCLIPHSWVDAADDCVIEADRPHVRQAVPECFLLTHKHDAHDSSAQTGMAAWTD